MFKWRTVGSWIHAGVVLRNCAEITSLESLVDRRTQISRDIRVTQIIPGTRGLERCLEKYGQNTAMDRPLGTRVHYARVRQGEPNVELYAPAWRKMCIEVRPGVSPRTFICDPPLKEVGLLRWHNAKLPWTWGDAPVRRASPSYIR